MPLIGQIVAVLADVGIALIVRGSVVLVAGLVVATLLRSQHAALRHAVLTATLVGAMAVPFVGRLLPPIHATISAANVLPSEVLFGARTSISDRAKSAVLPVEGVRVSTPSSRFTEVIPPLLAGLWVFGVVLVLCRVALGWLSSRRLVGEAQPASDRWMLLVRETASRLGEHRSVGVLCHASLSVPVAAGALRPVIVLPTAAESWTADRARLVIAHELAHVRRYDCLIEYVAALACALYWFHPLAWRIALRLRVERERSCDDVVLRLGTAAPDYAEHLVDLAATVHRSRWKLGTILAMAPIGPLESRVNDILAAGRRRGGLTRFMGAAVVAGTAFVVTPLSTLQPRPRSSSSVFAASAALDTTDLSLRPGETMRWSGAIAVGASISIRSNMGDIEIDTTSSTTLEVVAERRAGAFAEPSDTRLSIIRTETGAIVCSVYVDPSRGRSHCEADGDWGRTNVRDNAVHLRVRVPANVHVRVQAGLGDVRVDGIRGNVSVLDGNGSAMVASGAAADVTAYTGMLSFTRLDGSNGGPIALRVLHGGISARGIGGLNVDAVADTGNVSVDGVPATAFSGRAGLVARIQKGNIEITR